MANPQRSRTGYRADIQGLRGFAICLVIAYHLWTSGRVSGGVDVFLFISAYLMTASFARKQAAFRLVDFLIQRFRRLVPMAAIVVAVTLIAGWFLLPPLHQSSLVAHGQASLLYWENWQMIADDADYTAPDVTRLNPFQHFWSLSVQGQVFVLMAAVFAAIAAARRRWDFDVRRAVAVCFGIATAASFAYALWLLPREPAVAYLSTWPRVWEFTLAGLVALLPRLAMPAGISRAVSWLGVALLLVTGLLFGRAAFPGWVALVPLASAAAVMLATGGANDRWHASWWLTRRPALFIANRAYSLYLWHWPVYAIYANETGAPARLDPVGSVIVLGVSLLLADLSTRLVERRFQGMLALSRRRYAVAAIAVFSLIASSASLGVTTLTDQREQATASLPAEQRPGARVLTPGATPTPTPVRRGISPGDTAISDDWPIPLPYTCDEDPTGLAPVGAPGWCMVYEPDGEPTRTVVIIGDSHAYQWTTALAPLAAEEGWRLIVNAMPACRIGSTRDLPGCPEYTPDTIAWLLELHPDAVVGTGSMGHPDAPEEADVDYAEAIRPLAEAGITMVNIRDNPRWPFSMPECTQRFGSLDSRCRAPRAAKLAQEWPVGELATLPGQHFLDFSDWLCPPGPEAECLGVIGNIYVYMDDNHLSRTYVDTLTEVFAEAWHEEVGW